MKRRPFDHEEDGDRPVAGAEEPPPEERAKKARSGEGEGQGEGGDSPAAAAAELGEDLVLEVLKRADARTLAAAACVSRRWRRLAEDERLWEAVCVRHWANIGCGPQQLRSVVLALGGFRRLHSLYLLPLLAPSSSSVSAPPRRPHLPARWGRDEVQLSLSLLSIGFFEKMNALSCKPGGGRG